ncbi:ArsR/SmtB family transcription factor [Tissierella creatinophila]|uniref:HTH-type transcriptional repressor CzrA n=1 Tax=Tissierella creatinophila DSM 6911 TaxID=1123403 RepID=A0A1U7M4S9_TISCR|nr:metalloregulator ArsR/SmtB family transcription factor [Tissierella creatinophila]OLS02285.1 HTH-type transcriptional repressor CzrA [Tissierella creatinophila DSM 6911]
MEKTKDKEVCIGHFAKKDLLNDISESLKSENGLDLLSKIFKAMGDGSRLKIIYILSKSPLCVCDIAQLLNMDQSLVSHHLRTLRNLNLVKFKRHGKQIVYSLDDKHVLDLLVEGLEHTAHL